MTDTCLPTLGHPVLLHQNPVWVEVKLSSCSALVAYTQVQVRVHIWSQAHTLVQAHILVPVHTLAQVQAAY